MSAKWLICLVNEAGFGPATFGFGGQYSIQLSYSSIIRIAGLSLPYNLHCIYLKVVAAVRMTITGVDIRCPDSLAPCMCIRSIRWERLLGVDPVDLQT